MTIFSVKGGERAVTVRYIPIIAWLYAVLAAYGVVDVLGRMNNGRIAVNGGSIVALFLLIVFTGFVLAIGGQLVLASFDRANNRIEVRRYGLNGISRVERPFSELVGLDIRMLRRSQHRIELRFRSGERLPLTSYYVVSFNNSGLRRLSDVAGIEPTMIAPEQKR